MAHKTEAASSSYPSSLLPSPNYVFLFLQVAILRLFFYLRCNSNQTDTGENSKKLVLKEMKRCLLLALLVASVASSEFIECVSIKTIDTGYIRVQIEFTHQTHQYNSNVTNIDRIAKMKTTLRFCLTKNTQLEHVYVSSAGHETSWNGEIFIKRKYTTSTKEEDLAIYCETGCTGNTGITKSVAFNSEINNAAVCPASTVCKFSASETLLADKAATVTMPISNIAHEWYFMMNIMSFFHSNLVTVNIRTHLLLDLMIVIR